MTRKITIKDSLAGDTFIPDYPIETGSNARGSYTKMNSGILVQEVELTVFLTTTAYGTLYYSYIDVNFPISFLNTKYFIEPKLVSSYFIPASIREELTVITASSCQFIVYSPVSQSNRRLIAKFTIYGRWK